MLARIQSGTYTHMCAYGIFIFYINLFINKLIYIYNINKMSISLKNDLHELEQIKNAIKTNFLALKKLREKKKSIELKLIEYLEKNKNINGLKYNNIIISIQHIVILFSAHRRWGRRAGRAAGKTPPSPATATKWTCTHIHTYIHTYIYIYI